MVPRGSGVIGNISSFGTRGYLHSVLYGMSKAGLDKMAADMAVELKGTGVTALSFWLGLIRNERMERVGSRASKASHWPRPKPRNSSAKSSLHWPTIQK